MSEETTEDKKEAVKLYELAFNLVSSVGEEGAKKELDSLKKLIEKHKGKVISSSGPVLINLAYTMVKKIESKKNKYSNAYFGWMKFEFEGDSLKDLKGDIDPNNNILRYMIINTVKETNIDANSLTTAEEKEEVKGDVAKADKVEVLDEIVEEKTEEEISAEVDKAIDDLITKEK